MMRLLLDENISPALVRLLAEIGVYSQSVPHVGLAGRPDHVRSDYDAPARRFAIQEFGRSGS